MMMKFLRLCLIGAVLIQGMVIWSNQFLDDRWWFFELFTHYAHYYVLLGTPVLIGMLWKQMNRSAFVMLALISMNLAAIAPYLTSDRASFRGDTSILASNVLYTNENLDSFTQLIDAERPDIFVVHEASDFWSTADFSDYPYQALTQETGIHGIFMASRTPGSFEEIPLGGHSGMQFIPSDESFQVLAVHPSAPVTPQRAADRNAQFQDIRYYVKNSERPTIVIGDFNATPWSPQLKALMRGDELRDARVGYGLLSTWHSQWPWLQLPIDHALVTEDVLVLDFDALAPLTGSDHLPIWLSLGSL